MLSTALEQNRVIIPDGLYSIEEAAELLRCKVSTMYSYTHKKIIRYLKCGGKILFKGQDLLNFLVVVA